MSLPQSLPLPYVGRPASPAERDYRLVEGTPVLLNDMARAAFGHDTGHFGVFTARAWDALPEAERERWRASVLEDLRAALAGDAGRGAPGTAGAARTATPSALDAAAQTRASGALPETPPCPPSDSDGGHGGGSYATGGEGAPAEAGRRAAGQPLRLL